MSRELAWFLAGTTTGLVVANVFWGIIRVCVRNDRSLWGAWRMWRWKHIWRRYCRDAALPSVLPLSTRGIGWLRISHQGLYEAGLDVADGYFRYAGMSRKQVRAMLALLGVDDVDGYVAAYTKAPQQQVHAPVEAETARRALSYAVRFKQHRVSKSSMSDDVSSQPVQKHTADEPAPRRRDQENGECPDDYCDDCIYDPDISMDAEADRPAVDLSKAPKPGPKPSPKPNVKPSGNKR